MSEAVQEMTLEQMLSIRRSQVESGNRRRVGISRIPMAGSRFKFARVFDDTLAKIISKLAAELNHYIGTGYNAAAVFNLDE